MSKLLSVFGIILLVAVGVGGSVTYANAPALQDSRVISVSGAIQFDTGSAHVPAVGLRVELRDDDSPYSHGPGDLLAVTETDAFGQYSFEGISNVDFDGPENRRAGGQDIRLVIVTDNGRVAVHSMQARPYRWASDTGSLLGARGLVRDVPDGAHIQFPTIQFDDDVEDFQAVRAFVTLAKGWDFAANAMAANGIENPDLGSVVARWPALLTTERGYDPETGFITLTTGDADFPFAVLHFQAHALMDKVLEQHGAEYPTACVDEESIKEATSQECAWVHGWGMFFASAVEDNPNYQTATEALNLESPLVELADGDAVSGRVAGALWDLLDPTNEGFDQYSSSFNSLWAAFTSGAHQHLRDFWDAWAAQGEPEEYRACMALPSLFQNTINYNTPPEFGTVPLITVDEDPLEPPSFPLMDYITDAECPFEELVIEIEDPDPAHATADLLEDGTLVVTPVQDFYGDIVIRVRVFDGIDSAIQDLTVNVLSVNDPPQISALPDRTVKVGQEISYQLQNSIYDPDHSLEELTLRVEPVQTPLDPPLDIILDPATMTVRFVPLNLNPGINAVELIVTDPEGGTARYTLLLEWEQLPNNAPIIDSNIPLVWEAHKGQIITMELLSFASDDRQDPSELAWCVDPETVDYATFSGCGTQTLVFTPDPANYLGDDEVTLIVQDRDGAENKVNVILRWTPEPNILPTINPPIPDFVTGINQKLVVDLSPYGHDQDDNEKALRWYVRFVDPEGPNPFVTGQGTQVLSFTPLVDFEGTIQAQFVVRDPKGGEAEQTVNLTWQKYHTYLSLIMRPFTQKPTQ